MILLHASGVGAWSWLYNVEELNRHYRTYAIDTLGDAGRSELNRRDYYPQDGQAQAQLYSEIADKLGIESAYVVGASEGRIHWHQLCALRARMSGETGVAWPDGVWGYHRVGGEDHYHPVFSAQADPGEHHSLGVWGLVSVNDGRDVSPEGTAHPVYGRTASKPEGSGAVGAWRKGQSGRRPGKYQGTGARHS